MVLPSWRRLHRVAEIEWEEETWGMGVTVCGLRGRMDVPGFTNRLGMPRCRHCCNAVGVPPGDGAPYNAGIEEGT